MILTGAFYRKRIPSFLFLCEGLKVSGAWSFEFCEALHASLTRLWSFLQSPFRSKSRDSAELTAMCPAKSRFIRCDEPRSTSLLSPNCWLIRVDCALPHQVVLPLGNGPVPPSCSLCPGIIAAISLHSPWLPMSKAGAVPGVQHVSGKKHFSSQHCTTTRALLVLTLCVWKVCLAKSWMAPRAVWRGNILGRKYMALLISNKDYVNTV